jgi:hypothetical protein
MLGLQKCSVLPEYWSLEAHDLNLKISLKKVPQKVSSPSQKFVRSANRHRHLNISQSGYPHRSVISSGVAVAVLMESSEASEALENQAGRLLSLGRSKPERY